MKILRTLNEKQMPPEYGEEVTYWRFLHYEAQEAGGWHRLLKQHLLGKRWRYQDGDGWMIEGPSVPTRAGDWAYLFFLARTSSGWELRGPHRS